MSGGATACRVGLSVVCVFSRWSGHGHAHQITPALPFFSFPVLFSSLEVYIRSHNNLNSVFPSNLFSSRYVIFTVTSVPPLPLSSQKQSHNTHHHSFHSSLLAPAYLLARQGWSDAGIISFSSISRSRSPGTTQKENYNGACYLR